MHFALLQRMQNMNLGSVLFATILVIGLLYEGNAESNGVGQKPPMGWNPRRHFFCEYDENIIRESADAMISTGLSKVGYEYVNIDDCWGEKHRDAQGNLLAKAKTFPSGIKALADHVHSLGLKLGIYADAGTHTCTQRMVGSLGHEEQDAKTFASWGIDYLKYDHCYSKVSTPRERTEKMSEALRKTGRPIFFNTLTWYKLAPKVANSWRATEELRDDWGSMTSIADTNDQFAAYAGPGGWNDPDILEVGNGKMTNDEYQSHFSIWALMKAPLLIGCDIRNMSKEILEIHNNKEVIDVNQDSLGVQGKKVNKQGDLEVWAGPLSNKRLAVILWNRSNSTDSVTAKWKDIGLSSNAVVQARDLWAHSYISTHLQGNLTSSVDSHACKMYVLSPVSG